MARARLLECLDAALAAVDARRAVAARLEFGDDPAPTHALAIGKAAARMMHGAIDALEDRIEAALVVTKHGHAGDLAERSDRLRVIEASHPVPDGSCLAAGAAVLEFLRTAPAEARFLVMVSGGASSLVEVLAPGLDAADLARINEWLLGSGLPIGAINRVRKRLSLIKGGRLVTALRSRPALCLMISDVPGDDPRAIGSGPLVPHVPSDIEVTDLALPGWLAALTTQAPRLPAAESYATVRREVILRPADARAAAARAALNHGYAVTEHRELLEGDAVAVGRRLGALLCAAPPGLQVWNSETTVVLPPHPGRGGRCQSLALAAALEIQGHLGVWLLAAGTDGTDGPGVDAGALVDGETVLRGADAGHDPRAALAAADAGRFLEASGDLIHTGPTGTNVMDLVLALRVDSGS